MFFLFFLCRSIIESSAFWFHAALRSVLCFPPFRVETLNALSEIWDIGSARLFLYFVRITHYSMPSILVPVTVDTLRPTRKLFLSR